MLWMSLASDSKINCITVRVGKVVVRDQIEILDLDMEHVTLMISLSSGPVKQQPPIFFFLLYQKLTSDVHEFCEISVVWCR